MAMIKRANWGDPIVSYDSLKNDNIKLASAGFGDRGNFSQKYKNVIAQYVEVIEKYSYNQNRFQRIGDYDPEFHYYRVISVHGDVPNDNGDMFQWGNINDQNSPELLRYDAALNKYIYQTFIGRGNFKDHMSDNVSNAVGVNLDCIANHKGRFIENLLAVDANKDPELVRAIDKKYIDSVSMGARVGYSMCSICGNMATNESQYCPCIRQYKGREMYHEGSYKLAFEDNREVNFVELSWVTVPADRAAKLIEKVASNKTDLVEATAILLSLYGENKTRNILNLIGG
jgi:hypothetical protein